MLAFLAFCAKQFGRVKRHSFASAFLRLFHVYSKSNLDYLKKASITFFG